MGCVEITHYAIEHYDRANDCGRTRHDDAFLAPALRLQLTRGGTRATFELQSIYELHDYQRLLYLLSEDARVCVFEGVGNMS